MAHEARVVSAHRMPDDMFAYAEAAEGRGLRAIIAGAGGAAGAPARLPEFDKFSVYFNLDDGTGKIRGIYAPEKVAPTNPEGTAAYDPVTNEQRIEALMQLLARQKAKGEK